MVGNEERELAGLSWTKKINDGRSRASVGS